MNNSSKNSRRLTLALRFTPKAEELLADFANARTNDAYERFELKWTEAMGLPWRGGLHNFLETQRAVQEIWEGSARGQEGRMVSMGLGLYQDHREYFGSSMRLLSVNWGEGNLWLSPRDINEYLWLSLLKHSKRLAMCANRANGCPAPFFIKSKPNQKFCSDACALPAQREFKRQWFREHGEEWREKWLKKRRKGVHKKKRSCKGRSTSHAKTR